MFSTVWNFKIFSSEPYSLEAGQLIEAIIVFAIGVFIASLVKRIIARKLSNYLNEEYDHRLVLILRTSYWIILLIFFYIALSILNMPLSTLSFMLGGLSIGLGFGLKDYLNNFFSGIIIIVERPFKIGDVVEIKGNIGRIADISLRCVRIYTEEKIDIIVPNSVALNECLINWTRTDNVIYAEVPISIAYSSDVDKATKLMKEAALKAEGILADPPPIVLFKSHGPYSLNFKILCGMEVNNKLERWEKESSFNYSINKHLRENGIKISYPKSDIHFNSDKPIDIKISRS